MEIQRMVELFLKARYEGRRLRKRIQRRGQFHLQNQNQPLKTRKNFKMKVLMEVKYDQGLQYGHSKIISSSIMSYSKSHAFTYVSYSIAKIKNEYEISTYKLLLYVLS